jgi:hypothetical protein
MSRWSRETVRETVFWWRAPFETARLSSRSASLNRSVRSSAPAAARTRVTALRTRVFRLRFRTRRFSDWR